MPKTARLIGCPVDSGKARMGCLMGPDAYRVAGLAPALETLGYTVEDRGNCALPDLADISADGPGLNRAEVIGWTRVLADTAEHAAKGAVPIFLGGDHSLSLGTGLGMARHAATLGKPLFVLWLDAHSDFHTPLTSASGNLHGTPLGYLAGRSGFDGFPDVPCPIPENRICLLGLRSVDPAEKSALQDSDVAYHDMRHIDEHGIAAPLAAFLDRVRAENGLLHVSLDVDFLDPAFAPAVGTTVPGGATLREAHLVMEMLGDSGLMSSLDLVELNPFLDERGRTAQVMTDLAASAMGRRIFDRPTRAYT